MNQINVFIELLRASVLGEEPFVPNDVSIDWDYLFELSARQNVLALVWESICKLPQECHPSRQQRISWGLTAQECVKKYSEQRIVLAEITSVCTSKGIKLLLLKGIGLSMVYPNPQLRTCSDIDIFLFEDYEKGNELFGDDNNVFKYKHTSFDYHNVHIENHRTPLDTNTCFQRKIERYIESHLSNSIKCSEGYYVLSPLSNLVYLLTHAIRHFEIDNLISLRMIMDIALFVKENQYVIDSKDCARVLKELNIDGCFALFMVIAEELLKQPMPLYNRDLLCQNDAEMAKSLFLLGKYEKESSLKKNNLNSLFRQWKWFLVARKLYKYIPKSVSERLRELIHQFGYIVKYVFRIPMNKALCNH